MNDPTPTLVQRFRAGDPAAGDELAGLHRPALLRFTRRYLGHDADAEDAVQEVFARVLQTETVPRDFRVWAFTIARNVCLNRLRARGAPVLRLATGVDLAEDRSGELTRMARAEDAEALGNVLERLKPGTLVSIDSRDELAGMVLVHPEGLEAIQLGFDAAARILVEPRSTDEA